MDSFGLSILQRPNVDCGVGVQAELADNDTIQSRMLRLAPFEYPYEHGFIFLWALNFLLKHFQLSPCRNPVSVSLTLTICRYVPELKI